MLFVLLAVAVWAAYANHFQNPFHFDDWHTVTDNTSIRSLGNLPRFFTDTNTSSVWPANRSWRPLVTASFAIDYWLGKGLNPFWFQLSTFVWYLALIALVFLLFDQLFGRIQADDSNRYLAWFGAALYGLHPACAETVNYVSQRAEVYSTLGVVAGLYLYAAFPGARKYWIYLAPVAAGLLAKPPALVFPALLFAYVCLFEDQSAARSLRASLPALGLSVFFGALQAAMTSSTFAPGGASPFAYRLTQPYVALRYFESFLLPIRLSADTDLKPLTSAATPEALAGFGFLALICLTAWFCSQSRDLRPIAFGLWWFLIALLPTALFPLAEVENDHRMFFPFIGLSLSAAGGIGLIWQRIRSRVPGWVPVGCVGLLLAVCGYEVHLRNEVWRDDVLLWRDVTIKSPTNGRGWMNYGTALMAKGDMLTALDSFQRALIYTPNYDLVEVNLGVASGALHRDQEADQHFQRAITLGRQDAATHFFYARWLHEKGRQAEAQQQLRATLLLNPAQAGARELEQAIDHDAAKVSTELPGTPERTPEQWLDLSLTYYQAHRYVEAVGAAQTAIYLRPNYAEAYNNVGAAYAGLELWDLAIQADLQALKFKPDYQLARNNLAWAMSHRPRRPRASE